MKAKHSDLVSNRRASHDYEILETLEAGIVLQGTEIKSLRANGGTLQDAYVKIFNNEAWLIGCNIAPYRFGNIHNHLEKRDRKLLLHKREIASLKTSAQLKGMAIVPLSMYLKDGHVKVKIAIAKGKNTVDKRHAIKEKDDKRHMEKMLKNFR